MAPLKKIYAKVVQLGVGLDLIGSKSTVSNRDAILEVISLGVKMISKKTKREVLLPWSNIKGCELVPGQDTQE